MPKSSRLLVSLALSATPLLALAATDTQPATQAAIPLPKLGKVQRIGDVALSPDGTRLAWVQEGKQPVIELADADGKHAQALDVGAKLADCSKSDLAWSPDSHRLAFIANCGHDLTNTKAMHMDVYLVDATGNAAPREVAQLAGYARALAWTANGQSLGFLYVPGATRRAAATAGRQQLVGGQALRAGCEGGCHAACGGRSGHRHRPAAWPADGAAALVA